MKPRIYPIPEAINPGKWDIKPDFQARVDVRERKMFVPLEHSAQAAAVRAHELAHAAFSPDRPPSGAELEGISPQTLQHVEDCRVNYLAAQQGVSFAAGVPPEIVQGCLRSAEMMVSQKVLCTFALAAFTDDEANVFLTKADEMFAPSHLHRDVFSEARFLIRYHARDFNEATVKTARYIDSMFLRDQKRAAAQFQPGKSHALQAEELDPAWGKCRIETPPLKAPKRQRGPRCSDSGVVFRAPWRVVSDQKVFRACLRAPRKGTVLIDASGSMNFDAEDIERLVKKIPAGVIAAYCGDGDEGVLRILAKHGRVVAPGGYEMPYSGNVVDGPALKWLGTQGTPRLWVCDGEVSGVDDQQSYKLTQEAAKLQRVGGIKRVNDMAEALRALK